MLKNVSGQNIAAQLIAKADGTPITSGTVTVYVTVDNGSQNAGSGTVSHKGNGAWNYAPTQGETNGDHVAYTWVHADAINVTKDVYTIPSTPWTEDEKEQLRYRLQLDGSQTAPAADAPLQMPVSADALNQSEQFAQDLAEIFDNTAPRKRIYIEGIDINPPEGSTGINITGEGFPLNIACQNSENIPAITIKGGGTTGEEIHLTNGKTNLLNLIRAEILNATGLNDYPNSSVGRRLSRIPNEDPGTEGGLPTVDSDNRIAGIQGTKNTLDALNDLSSAGAEAAAANAINSYDGATKTELDAAQAAIEALINALNNLSQAQVQAIIEAALQAINLDHLIGDATDIPPVPAGTYLDQIMRQAAGTFDRETDSLEALASSGGGGITPEQVKQQIVDALSVDTYPDPTAPPPNPATLKDMIAWVFARGLGVFIQTAIDQTLKDRTGTNTIAARTIEATPTQVTLGEWQE